MRKDRFQLVLFDFDGTLADSFPWFLSVFNEVARRYRFRAIAPGDVERLRGLSSRELIRHLGIAWWKIPLIARHMRRLAARETGRIAPFAGVTGLLTGLTKAGLEIGIVTSNSEAKVRQVLGEEAVRGVRYYQCRVGMFAKRRALQRVLKRSGVPADRAIYIGDETRDAEAARALGMPFAAVGWGYGNPETLRAHGAGAVFLRIEEIARYLA